MSLSWRVKNGGWPCPFWANSYLDNHLFVIPCQEKANLEFSNFAFGHKFFFVFYSIKTPFGRSLTKANILTWAKNFELSISTIQIKISVHLTILDTYFTPSPKFKWTFSQGSTPIWGLGVSFFLQNFNHVFAQ